MDARVPTVDEIREMFGTDPIGARFIRAIMAGEITGDVIIVDGEPPPSGLDPETAEVLRRIIRYAGLKLPTPE